MKTKKDLPAVLAQLHLKTQGSGFLFGFGPNQDFREFQLHHCVCDGWRSEPSRSRLLHQRTTSAPSTSVRSTSPHVQKMLELLGDKPDVAQREAAKIMEIETSFAKASLNRVEQRDPYKLFHKVDFKGLQAMTPSFDWAAYLKTAGLALSIRFQRHAASLLRRAGKTTSGQQSRRHQDLPALAPRSLSRRPIYRRHS